MSTLGWLFILMAGLVLRQVYKGRVLQTPEDISDAFLAIVTGNSKNLTAVLARKGEYTQPDQAVEGMGSAPGIGDTDTGKYKLGAVKPYVASVANAIGPMFGIKTIGGWRAVGSVPNSAHPKGLALDFMINNIPDGKSVGDKLAAYAVTNASTYGITEVIWYRRIWTAAKGWHDYHGPSDHTDHVHLTFGAK